MNDRDWELLDRQTRNLQPPPRPDGLMMLILAGVFFAGMTLGSLFFGIQPPVQTATNGGKTALAFFFNGNRSELGRYSPFLDSGR
jgi:hypothetical protein